MTALDDLPSEGRHAHAYDLRAFQGVEAWVFDLDNTLYPAETDLFSQINDRIADYIARLLGVGKDEASAKQKDFYRRHGTTLRGLMIEHNIDPDDFLAHVHDIDYSPVKPDPALGQAIASLPGRKFIFTNGDRAHAERTAAALGVTDHFEDIFDIVAAGLMPKPNKETYDLFLARTGVSPARAAMFEDLTRNLLVPHRLGMRTVLVVPSGTREVFREDWELEGQDAPHVDFVTDNLTGFLRAVLGSIELPIG
ncbi:pyrimidine 5'-nucleotidase [Polymorphum gilvum]|uniref:Haloacid dehalogenase-like hydrolase:HAD-superfamily hydrolase, subfamily IA, variant 3 n=1 Tax=Polymorphum gilvum (strain LMG 25793 / CGMCC 1.9160 / SL003B-26A1) TaxID=991905 RepID=F2J1Z8_POLGS|nr:pyrimidine 5'-nucleotidase [Polymorphum gilvum]ADZ72059.1 Haloacid dehalogenase-like hydrolase:HAD-superfamily hydrolase, subfamily IA, variant 3 [Polymorphum gilvum SL003B-26A1]